MVFLVLRFALISPTRFVKLLKLGITYKLTSLFETEFINDTSFDTSSNSHAL